MIMIQTLSITVNIDEKTGIVDYQVSGNLLYEDAARILISAARAQPITKKEEKITTDPVSEPSAPHLPS